MREKNTKNKVRDFECTKADAGALAKCFNSFDDADSWPGGFTHGTPFTAERVLEQHEKQDRIRACVAYKGEEIVGYCDIAEGELDPESAYIGLLGVNPAFQGQGFGKALLLEVTETAAKKGKRRLDLHTWGGNQKAMPLYKKVGWNWVPKTRVLMENYIPEIIACELFKAFFERYYWYEALNRELTQEPDDITEEGIGIYRYRFSGENGDELEVIIDREAKGICGFSLTLDDQTISAMLKPEQQEGYIGFGAKEFTLEVRNSSKSPMKLSIEKEAKGALLVQTEEDSLFVIEPDEKFELQGQFILGDEANHLDRDKNPDEKVETYVEFHLNMNGEGISLFSGIIPIQPVSLSTGPEYPCLVPGETQDLDLIIENCTNQEFEGIVLISSDSNGIVLPHKESFQLKSDEIHTFKIDVTPEKEIRNKETRIAIEIQVIEDEECRTLRKEELVIPVLDTLGAIAYQALNNSYILETSAWRMRLNPNPPMEVRAIENKISGHTITGWFYLPQIGYPFPDAGSEWSQKKFTVKLENDRQKARIILRGDSNERPGLQYKAIYSATREGLLQVSVELRNTGKSNYENVGVRIGGWSNERGDRISIPLTKGLYQLDTPEWTGRGQIPKRPQYFREEWAAIEINNDSSLIGTVWNQKDIQSIQLARRPMLPTLEYKLGNLRPGEQIERKLVSLVIGQGDWKKVRRVWGHIQSTSFHDHRALVIRKDLEITFQNLNDDSTGIAQPVLFLDKAKENRSRMKIEIIHRDPIEATGSLRLPSGISSKGKKTIDFHTGEFNIDQPFSLELELSCETGCRAFCQGGAIELKFPDRIVTIPFVAVVYDSQSKSRYAIDNEHGTDLYLVKSEKQRIGVSPEYSASLVSFGQGDRSVFYDTFPEANPFIWDDEYYSGVTPILQNRSVWDWQSAVPKENWAIKQVERGPWHGYEMTSLLEYCPEMEDIEVSICHLLLQGVPLVYSSINLRNKSKKWNRVHFGLRGVPRLGDSPQSEIHTVVGGNRINYKPTPVSTTFRPDSKEGWGAFYNPETNQVLGIISNRKANRPLSLKNGGEKVQWMVIEEDADLEPGESRSLECFFVITSSTEIVESIKNVKSLRFDKNYSQSES